MEHGSKIRRGFLHEVNTLLQTHRLSFFQIISPLASQYPPLTQPPPQNSNLQNAICLLLKYADGICLDMSIIYRFSLTSSDEPLVIIRNRIACEKARLNTTRLFVFE